MSEVSRNDTERMLERLKKYGEKAAEWKKQAEKKQKGAQK
jgi:hypothetical protein